MSQQASNEEASKITKHEVHMRIATTTKFVLKAIHSDPESIKVFKKVLMGCWMAILYKNGVFQKIHSMVIVRSSLYQAFFQVRRQIF